MLTELAHSRNASRYGGIKKHSSLDQNSSQSIQRAALQDDNAVGQP